MPSSYLSRWVTNLAGKTNDRFSRRSSSVPLKPPPLASPFATDDVFHKGERAGGAHKIKYTIDSPFATNLKVREAPSTAGTRATSSMSGLMSGRPKPQAGRYLASRDDDSARDGIATKGRINEKREIRTGSSLKEVYCQAKGTLSVS
jgi:hypothetical protein